MRRIRTEEEKVANKISDIISDTRLDLDRVGYHIAETAPTTTYNRLLLITEAAEFEKENSDVIRARDTF
jgi:hypothetical protein